jgi:hypothetical protein
MQTQPSGDDDQQRPHELLRPIYPKQTPSGLIVASATAWAADANEGDEVALGAMLAAPTAQDLGLGVVSLQDAIDLVSGVPFQPAMLLAAALAAELYHHPRDVQRQLMLARQILPDGVVAAMAEFVAEDPDTHVVFDPRFVHALQRVLLVHAAEDPTPPRGLDEGEIEQVAGALLALGSGLPAAVPPEVDVYPPDWRGWTNFVTQASGWYGDPYVLEAVARAYTMFSDIASSDNLRQHHAYSEVNERLRDAYGLDLAQQLAAGLGAAFVTKALEPEIPPERRPDIGPEFLGDGPLGERADEVIGLLSATREDLRAMLLAAGDTPERIAWDHSVLEAHPLVRLPDGRMRLSSPRSLVAWMTRGMHYRLLDAAGRGLAGEAKHRSRGLFLTYTGALGQEYVRRVIDASLRVAQRSGAVRLLPETEYWVGGARKDSPDVGIDAGPDLVLVEVYSGRMGVPARTGADPKALGEFVDRATGEKLVELAERTRELLSGNVVYDDVDLAVVRRLFPVVVLAGEPLIQQPLLWGHLRDRFPTAWIDDLRVQDPVVLDLDDLEALLGLAEEGHHVPDLLAAFLASPLSELPLRTWAIRTYGDARRPSYIVEQFTAARQSGADRLFRRR